jgi:putative aldouronate transport system permease protein
MTDVKTQKTDGGMILLRLNVIALLVAALVPALNPARMSALFSKNSAFFTIATSFNTATVGFSRALKRGWVEDSTLQLILIVSIVVILLICTITAGCCMSLGKKKLKKLGTKFILFGSIGAILVQCLLLLAYRDFQNTEKPDHVEAMLPMGFIVFIILFVGCIVLSIVNLMRIPQVTKEDKYEMESKYKLFLMMLPFVILVFAFSYLPLWGWRYSFFDYKAGLGLSAENFVGFKWFTYLLQNPATRSDILRVIKNTLVMSGIGIATAWVPMVFAIFLTEIKFGSCRRLVQTLTTIPNFISWVLVYTFAFAIFSTEGFINSVLIDFGIVETGVNYLMSGENIWFKMWAWGTWKGLGWGAIIYIAGISGIDQQLYEAATVDGAGRFRRMWHITVPGLIPTFFVLLLLSIAGILSNGMDQYFVFKNSANKATIEVLDLYVYTIGIGKGGSGNIPLATAVGMLKSIISVTLLMGANRVSKIVRGDSII